MLNRCGLALLLASLSGALGAAGKDFDFDTLKALAQHRRALSSKKKDLAAMQGESCKVTSGAQCDTGLSCLSYYGVAGASGPEFRTCEIPCSASASQCPGGQACVTVADGPGQVCQAGP